MASAPPGQPRIVSRDVDLPPPPPGVRYVRLPWRGTVVADDDLRDLIAHKFHWPMIILAVLVLPLIGMELFYLPRLPEQHQVIGQRIIIAVEIIISLAFLVEFVVKVSIAESRWEYIRRNWLDIIVILLPFLRMLRVLRVAKVAQTSRAFRLRGVGMKFTRYLLSTILGLKYTDRLLRKFGMRRQEGYQDPMRMTRYQLRDEVTALRRRVDAWEEWYSAHQDYLAKYHQAAIPPPPEEKATPDSETSREPPVETPVGVEKN